ncbi:tetratricopeptide repeat protein, partial [Kitasatospora sp. NPDC056184]|uniref:tetratricopeptide repeat protein n=1 Tax=Kitasatospora sp. NPDC056184 TaxID=3345738 RepID=UPI0035DA37E3
MSDNGRVANDIVGGVFLQAVVQGRDIRIQLPAEVVPALSGLPAPTAAFTGRERHVEHLLADLAPGGGGRQAVLVSAVSGLAGIGKTELVVQTAARALRRPGWFPGGVLFTDVAGYDPERRLTPERALDGLLHALGVPGEHIPAGLEERQQLYRSVLSAYAEHGRRVLVVVDNASSVEQARPLLPTDGTTAALVTSRHTLDGLDARLHDLDSLGAVAAVALLDEALRHARHGDTRIADDPAAAATIARLCAGLPLALRIAAAALSAAPRRPAADLARSLGTEHGRLDALRRPDRAVRAAFDLSYRLLDPEHARLFRLLPLNPGPDVSTEAVAHLVDTTAERAGELLQDLADAHLVEPAAEWGRWRMHDLVRVHADEHGRARGEDDGRPAALDRLFSFYRDTASAASSHLTPLPGRPAPRFADQLHALAWLDSEHTNLTAVALVAHAFGHADVTTHLAVDLAAYLGRRRLFTDWALIAELAVAVHRELGDRQREGAALDNLGLGLQDLRRFEEAVTAHTQALAIFRELGDRHGEGQTLNNLGLALRDLRRLDQAHAAHTQALTICRELGDRHGEGQSLNNLGIVVQILGRFEEAVDAYAEDLAICRELGDRHGEGQTLNNLGIAFQDLHRFEEAVDAHTQALTICREFGDRHGEGQAFNNLGVALRKLQRFEEAVDAYAEDLAICRELGDRHGEGQTLNNL